METTRVTGLAAVDEMIVEGYLSSEAVDSHGTVFTRDATARAMGEYVGKRGAVNVMHDKQSIPVGKVTGWRQDDDKTWFRVQLVDTEAGKDAWKAVKAGILRGFSIEFADYSIDQRDNATYITDYTLVRVSLTDAPSNPDAQVTGFRAWLTNTKQRLTYWLAGDKESENMSENRQIEALEARLKEADTKAAELETRAAKAEQEVKSLKESKAEADKKLDAYLDAELRAELAEAGFEGAELDKLVSKRAAFEADPELLDLYRPKKEKVPRAARAMNVQAEPEGDASQEAEAAYERAMEAAGWKREVK